MNSVIKIVDDGLCIGCCNCFTSCSNGCISFIKDANYAHPVPYIDEQCNDCGECLRQCSINNHIEMINEVR